MSSDRGRDLVDAFADAVIHDVHQRDAHERLRRRSGGEGGPAGDPGASDTEHHGTHGRHSTLCAARASYLYPHHSIGLPIGCSLERVITAQQTHRTPR
jgi:hypothetical protein